MITNVAGKVACRRVMGNKKFCPNLSHDMHIVCIEQFGLVTIQVNTIVSYGYFQVALEFKKVD